MDNKNNVNRRQRNIRTRRRRGLGRNIRRRNQSRRAFLEQRYKNRKNLKLNRNRQIPNERPSIGLVNSLGMPDDLYVDLVWAGIVDMQTVTAQVSVMYEGNNPWDPDPQLGGTSARDYQILQLLYRYCRVYASEIEVTGTIVNGNPFELAVFPMNKSVGVSYDLAMTLPRVVRSKPLTESGITSTRLVNYCSTRSIFGIENLDYDLDHNYDLDNSENGTSVTEPNQRWFWYIYASSNGSQSGINCALNVQIRYKCKFFSKIYHNTLSTVSSDGDISLPPMVVSNVKLINQTALTDLSLASIIEDQESPLILDSGKKLEKPIQLTIR